jgi:hypothetical protein
LLGRGVLSKHPEGERREAIVPTIPVISGESTGGVQILSRMTSTSKPDRVDFPLAALMNATASDVGLSSAVVARQSIP